MLFDMEGKSSKIMISFLKTLHMGTLCGRTKCFHRGMERQRDFIAYKYGMLLPNITFQDQKIECLFLFERIINLSNMIECFPNQPIFFIWFNKFMQVLGHLGSTPPILLLSNVVQILLYRHASRGENLF